jgi:hypothetical protein
MKLLVSLAKKFSLVAALSMLAACSKDPAPTVAPNDVPLVAQAGDTSPAAHVEEFRSTFAPGGIAASYSATFSANQIKTITETRKANDTATARSGEYEFHGARLIKYQGAALGSAENIALEFDRQGKVLVARAGENTVSAEEISAIRDRAQSLRSHAVAQHAVRGHEKP